MNKTCLHQYWVSTDSRVVVLRPVRYTPLLNGTGGIIIFVSITLYNPGTPLQSYVSVATANVDTLAMSSVCAEALVLSVEMCILTVLGQR